MRLSRLNLIFLMAALALGMGVFATFVTPKLDSILHQFIRGEAVVTLTENGFSPKEITIKKGETVRFVTTLEDPFWPASDLHPTHTIYAAFDPKAPVDPSKGWEFTFSEEGRWRYHDHLDPQNIGIVIVQDKDEKSARVEDFCDSLQGSAKIQCFDQTLEQHLKEGGIEAAFEYFVSIYAKDSDVPEVCHGWAHRLGEVEFELYKEGKEVSLRKEAAFCSYGYFHGFINAMVKETQSLESARAFCEQAIQKNDPMMGDMGSHCIHGIGHSIATLALQDQMKWGDLQPLVEKGVSACDELYATSSRGCIDGMLHEIYLSMVRGDYGLSTHEYKKSGDIFYYCREFQGALAESCYYESITLWPHFIGSDKKEVVQRLFAQFSDLFSTSPRLLHTLARSFIEADMLSGSFKESVEACALVPEELWAHCLEGIALGFLTHGDPLKVDGGGLAFCTDYYEKEARSLCLQKMLEGVERSSGQSALQSACTQLARADRPPLCDQ